MIAAIKKPKRATGKLYRETARIVRENIAACRRSRGLTQTELGQMVGLKQARIAMLEVGFVNAGREHSSLPLDVVCGIAEALDVSVVSLFTENCYVTPEKRDAKRPSLEIRARKAARK